MNDLTGFQRDLLYVITGLDDPHGLAIKDELEDYYEKEVHHGRLYPNLDTLVNKGLVEKGVCRAAAAAGPSRPAPESPRPRASGNPRGSARAAGVSPALCLPTSRPCFRPPEAIQPTGLETTGDGCTLCFLREKRALIMGFV